MVVAHSPARSARSAPFHALTVADVEHLCDDAVAVTFDVPPELADAYAFAPGQSLTLRRTVGGREERRSYSICAPVGARPRIGVREIPDGIFSGWLARQVRPGDQIEVQGPTGTFTANPRAGGRHLCIAVGSGITPLLSITSSLLAHGDAEVALLYGNRTSRSVMFAEELGDLKNTFGARLQVVHVLSREPRDVELFSGRLDADRLRRILDVLLPVELFDDIWLCGPFAMINDAREVLTELGVSPGRIHVELFYADAPPPELRRVTPGPDGPTTDVTVILDGRSATAAMPQDQTILDAAQASRPDLPFACKGGVCGTCRARVTDGEVDMRRNYALEPAEIDAGFVLTCQSYPVGASVTVDFDA
ncbi:1,2-phenylacetyl-CoA epoxidase subunit PaaE [Georgenia thermotolerans]|uniref:Phenylacetate-CoA oxygenase/reductase subunit PaaK n=1 Tax=Georgenia thermotolerans TaxID=527326 RepID=A0A7J5URC3_9MICO|nr:1,2-phenylacetyl-CoA epoxidase subunit PaaE [Georgenia thermotolerans]KAE8764975.1 phenylacetate-CoA oxygenase/reductase subunit PaaK [Georgenia thermotolerans]